MFNVVSKFKCKTTQLVLKIKNRERTIHRGKQNPDKIFYVIGIPYKMAGLFAIVNSTLSHIIYAIGKNYIPIVDLANYPSQYLDLNIKFTDNAWEYFFQQPAYYTLKDIVKSKNIILSKKEQTPNVENAISVLFTQDEYIDKLKEISSYFRKYIRFNDDTFRVLNEKYEKLIHSDDIVLGVLCRGTDYLKKKPKYHPIQPDPRCVLDKVISLSQELNFTKVYLATEDHDIYDIFLEALGDKLITNGQYLYRDVSNVQYLSEIVNSRSNDKYLRGIEYLTSIYILSKCTYFIGGMTAGSLGVLLMNSEFEYKYIWNLGTYK